MYVALQWDAAAIPACQVDRVADNSGVVPCRTESRVKCIVSVSSRDREEKGRGKHRAKILRFHCVEGKRGTALYFRQPRSRFDDYLDCIVRSISCGGKRFKSIVQAKCVRDDRVDIDRTIGHQRESRLIAA